MYDGLKNQIQSSAETIASDLNLNVDALKNYKLPSNSIATIIDNKGHVILDNSDLSWTGGAPYRNDTHWQKSDSSKEWLIYDKAIKLTNNKIMTVRICVSQKPTEDTLRFFLIMMIIGGTCFVTFAILGGLAIASKALSPISMIIKTAKEIESGDLSKRIQGIESKDEVGILAETFNSMLIHLETSFNREKQFASDASHELRTPIAIIMNTSEELINSKKNDTSNISDEHLIIFEESRRMERIISQLLFLTRGDEGKYQVNIEQVNVVEVISVVMEQLEDYKNDHQITMAYSISNNVLVDFDQTLLTQLFLNLIQNAIKYSVPGGNIAVDVTENQNQVIAKIIDNGIGISPEDLPHIFERFYRADKVRDRTGTGLGLSIVQWIVDIHHAKIEVFSKLGQNTVFTITFWKSSSDWTGHSEV